MQNVQTFADAGGRGPYEKRDSRGGAGWLRSLIVAFDLQFGLHPENIDTWTFGPVVASVCRFARTGDLRPD
jgi:hypothetical protein